MYQPSDSSNVGEETTGPVTLSVHSQRRQHRITRPVCVVETPRTYQRVPFILSHTRQHYHHVTPHAVITPRLYCVSSRQSSPFSGRSRRYKTRTNNYSSVFLLGVQLNKASELFIRRAFKVKKRIRTCIVGVNEQNKTVSPRSFSGLLI